jgi:hypothetical protein
MEDHEVKMILIPKFQMKDKSLDDNYKSKELVVHIEVDFEVQNEEFMVQKFEVSISMELANFANVSAQLT